MTDSTPTHQIGAVGDGSTVVQGDNNNVTINATIHQVNLTPELLQQALVGALNIKSPADLAKLTAVASPTSDGNDPIDFTIKQLIKQVGDGSARAALKAYERLWKEEAAGALPRIRYRLQANMAQIHLRLGDRKTAIRLYRAAYAEDPDTPAAKAMLATALLLEGEKSESFKLACEILQDDSSVKSAAAVILDAAPDTCKVTEVKALIPVNMHDQLEVLLGLSMRASMDGDHKSAAKYARKAAEQYPEDWQALAALGSALLAPIAETEGLKFTRNLPDEFKDSFAEALKVMRKAWSLILDRDDAIQGSFVAANLISVLGVAGLPEEAETVLNQALKIAPNDPIVVREHVQNLISKNDWPGVKCALSLIKDSEQLPADKITMLQALTETGEPEKALAEAKKIQESVTDGRLIEMAGAARIDAAVALDVLDEHLNDVLIKSPESIILRSVAISHLSEDDSRQLMLINEIERLISTSTDPRERLHAADSFYKLKHYSKAADLYAGTYGEGQHHEALYRRLTTLYLADRRTDARMLYEGLAPTLKDKPEYGRLGIAIYERSGMLPQARNIIERLLTFDDNLNDRLYWLTVAERMGDTKTVTDWLARVPQEQQGDPRALMFLTKMIDKYQGGIKSLPFAYRALRNGFDDQAIHLDYAFGLFVMGNVRNDIIISPTTVTPDCVVTLKAIDSEQELVRIIETESEPKLERYEIAPTDPLAQLMLGAKLDDTIELPNLAFGTQKFHVAAIQNKYLYAHIRTIQSLHTMFPGSQAFATLSVNPQAVEDSFKPIFESAKARHDFSTNILEMYQSSQLPIAMAAKFSNCSPFDIWDTIRSKVGTNFRCCAGNAEEFNQATKILTTNRRAVVDPATLYGLVRLGIAPIVKNFFEELGIVQTTLDLARDHLNEQKKKKGRQSGSIGWDGEAITKFELTDEHVDYLISKSEEVMNFAESLTIVPSESASGMDFNAKNILIDWHPSFLDTILAAQGDNRILLCDDFSFRMLAAEVAGIEGVWTQAAARTLYGEKSIDQNIWHSVTRALVESKYFFTSIGSHDFLFELRGSEWRLNQSIRDFAELLSLPSNDPLSVIQVLSELMFHGWREKTSVDAYVGFFSMITSVFCKKRDNQMVFSLLQSAFSSTAKAAYAKGRREFFKKKLRGTTAQVRVETLASHADQVAERISGQIADALNKGIRDSQG